MLFLSNADRARWRAAECGQPGRLARRSANSTKRRWKRPACSCASPGRHGRSPSALSAAVEPAGHALASEPGRPWSCARARPARAGAVVVRSPPCAVQVLVRTQSGHRSAAAAALSTLFPRRRFTLLSGKGPHGPWSALVAALRACTRPHAGESQGGVTRVGFTRRRLIGGRAPKPEVPFTACRAMRAGQNLAAPAPSCLSVRRPREQPRRFVGRYGCVISPPARACSTSLQAHMTRARLCPFAQRADFRHVFDRSCRCRTPLRLRSFWIIRTGSQVAARPRQGRASARSCRRRCLHGSTTLLSSASKTSSLS